jgi:uncharacterized protein (DUF486 family)
MKLYIVPAVMFLSSGLMAMAWLGHLKFMGKISFTTALLASWLLVLPEYVLNVFATRYGLGTYNGAQMASFHLAFGVICVALVSRFVLGEKLIPSQIAGVVLLLLSVVLITYRPQETPQTTHQDSEIEESLAIPELEPVSH